MKKLVLMLSLVFAFSLMNFTSSTKTNKIERKIKTSLVIEELNSIDETVNCRWRSCSGSGEDRICGEWTYGTCEKDGDGTLTPNRISQ